MRWRRTARGTCKDKRFTFAAVLALSLAIGVNNSVFTIVNMVFLRAVPFEDGHQLVSVGTVTPRGDQGGMSLPDPQDLEQASLAFERFVATTGGRMNVSDAGRVPERFRGAYVPANAFRLLRSAPILGRDFLSEDDRRAASRHSRVWRDSTAAAAAALREEVHAIDPDLPLFGVETFDQAIARSRIGVQLVGTWFGVIAIITLVVASVGLFALTAHGVAQRQQEIGVRIALGAQGGQVVWMFVRRTLRQLAAGLAIGLVGALTVGQFIGYLGTISPRDPVTIALVSGLLVVVAVIATILPARRAARIDPMTALRAD